MRKQDRHSINFNSTAKYQLQSTALAHLDVVVIRLMQLLVEVCVAVHGLSVLEVEQLDGHAFQTTHRILR